MELKLTIPDGIKEMSVSDQEKVVSSLIQVIGETLEAKANVEAPAFFTALSSTIGYLIGLNCGENTSRAVETACKLIRHSSMYGQEARKRLEAEPKPN